MVKAIAVGASQHAANIGTAATWYKNTDITLVNNSGQTPIRLDKVMIQLSGYTTFTGPGMIGVLVHITDETGASMTASVTEGTTNDAALTTLMNQWKDNIFMTDFRLIGSGYDESLLPVISLEADTRRILKPGQQLRLSILAEPLSTETTKAIITVYDSIIWYSAAAQ